MAYNRELATKEQGELVGQRGFLCLVVDQTKYVVPKCDNCLIRYRSHGIEHPF